jgi:hypothetical protein
MAYKIYKFIDLYQVKSESGEVIFYSNDGYITDQTDPAELKEELVVLYGVMDDTDVLEWA